MTEGKSGKRLTFEDLKGIRSFKALRAVFSGQWGKPLESFKQRNDVV